MFKYVQVMFPKREVQVWCKLSLMQHQYTNLDFIFFQPLNVIILVNTVAAIR
jgi:hypothetical protein